MAELFTDFAQFKSFIGGAVNTSLDMRSIAPVIEDTARTHLVPYLSQAFYDEMVTAAAGSPTAAQTSLLPYMRKALAKLTLSEYIKIGNVELGELGLHRIETETRKATFKYQDRNYSYYFLTKGYDDIEAMLKYLCDNVSLYPTWSNKDEAAAHRDMLLNYSSQIRATVQRDCDRWTYETLKPMINTAMTFQVREVIPALLYDSLVTKYKANTLTTKEKELLTRIRTAVAHRAISEGIKQRWVQYQGGRVVAIENFGESADSNLTLPPQAFTSVYWQGDINSQQYTRYWVDYMKTNAADFPLAFDTSSGGTNTDTDAWHINTDEENETVAYARDTAMKKPIFSM